MDKEIKAKWIEALLSGEYKQGRGSLRRGGMHCCLGVLCEIAPPTKPRDEVNDWWDYGSLPFDYQWPGIALDAENANKLAEMNDRGATFNEIATYIGAHL